MSKKTVEETGPTLAVRICFERILPDEMDPERVARRRLGEQMVAMRGASLKADGVPEVMRMAVPLVKKWAPGTQLKCRFLEGSTKVKKKIEAVAHQWEPHANIKFKFVASGPAEIRIALNKSDGSWSAVGRDALITTYFPLHQPTMNYGWLDETTPDEEYSRTVLHEFGHALGCIHEHQGPKFTRVWNRDAVLRYFSGPPNYWSPEDIEHNVLSKYGTKGMKFSKYDPKSIMLYEFDAALFSDGLGPTNSNTKLSPTDISMIRSLYP
ncbi:MAG: M12 family metallopeptidase [Planctomycetaceae bacterium]|jgi:hypothetical protein